MPGYPTVAKKLRGRGPFREDARLDPSQVQDNRVQAPWRYTKWEDGTASWYPDPAPGGLDPQVSGGGKWVPLPKMPKMPMPRAPLPKKKRR